VIPATSYTDLQHTDIGPNRNWSSDLKKLKWSAPGLLEELEKPGPAAKTAALEQRAMLRAYNGAPPVIPHAVNQMSADNCMMCHEEGLKIVNRTAKMCGIKYPTYG